MLILGIPSSARCKCVQAQTANSPSDFDRPGIFSRAVFVNRRRSPKEAIDATNRKQCVDSQSLISMPKGAMDRITVIFFRVGYFVGSHKVLDKEYKLQRFVPVDPYSLAAVNEADDELATLFPNLTYWKGPDGNYHMAAFSEGEDGKKQVYVGRSPGDFFRLWWYAAVPQPPDEEKKR